MAECTCANPQAVAQAINKSASTISGKIESAGRTIDETLYGKSLNGSHGSPAPVRFCHWAAPEYGGVGENAWTNFFRAAQLAIALLNATIQGQIADKQQDLANGYYQQAKYKWDRFDKRYRPLEESILDETSSVPIREMNCDDDRDRAALAVGSAYDTIGAYMTRKARALRLCLDPTSVDQLEFGRNLLLVDTEIYTCVMTPGSPTSKTTSAGTAAATSSIWGATWGPWRSSMVTCPGHSCRMWAVSPTRLPAVCPWPWVTTGPGWTPCIRRRTLGPEARAATSAS